MKIKIMMAIMVVLATIKPTSALGIVIIAILGMKLPVNVGISLEVVGLVALIIVGIIAYRQKKLYSVAQNSTYIKPNVTNHIGDEYTDIQLNVTNHIEDVTNDFHLTIDPEADCSVSPNLAMQYDLAELKAATNNFSNDNKIGRGGFGIVYKGTLDGQQVAVKRLSNGSNQGDKEFQTEITFLAKLQHKNLVRLLGFCIADEEAMLVYEFVANKSLDFFLFDIEKRPELHWSTRLEIIKGVALGMKYLHEGCSITTMHRDLKAANVLLDAQMHPKIADFGLARICDNGQTHIQPTQIVGTQGYMAPEYLYNGKFSTKSDVYALGVLILEIVSGRRVGGSSYNQPGGEGLLSYAWRRWEDEKPLEVMDPLLADSFSIDEVAKCVQLGLLCVQDNGNLRPTMTAIVKILLSSGDDVVIPMPQPPAYMYTGSSDRSTTMSSSMGNTTRSSTKISK